MWLSTRKEEGWWRLTFYVLDHTPAGITKRGKKVLHANNVICPWFMYGRFLSPLEWLWPLSHTSLASDANRNKRNTFRSWTCVYTCLFDAYHVCLIHPHCIRISFPCTLFKYAYLGFIWMHLFYLISANVFSHMRLTNSDISGCTVLGLLGIVSYTLVLSADILWSTNVEIQLK